ncbi:MAG: hypothetical protein NXH85_04725 [Pseudomonadaceae bacterium]|nr:hypothetical protein [Pseudomonadaceae bacterium]
MQYLHGFIALVFLAFAAVHLTAPEPVYWISVYVTGAILTVLTLSDRLTRLSARVLALFATIAMFFYFAGFFRLAPYLSGDWYTTLRGLDAIGLLFGAFAMISVLSDYSCRLKARCDEARRTRRRAFFTAPRPLERTAD